jgi:hypothetical protein
VRRLKNQKSKDFNSAGKYAEMSGCLEPPESPEYKRWLASLPPYMLSLMTEELEAREREAAKKQSSI